LSKKILYAVLNWGLGHASRSIPIINYLLSKNHEVIIASDGEALILLKKEFPKLKFENLCPYNAIYSKKSNNFNRTIFFQLNKFSKAIKEEHLQVKTIIKKHNITHIVSDNRYGVYSKQIPSTIICHQINLQHNNKFIQQQMNKLHYSKLDKFNEIWIPDYEKEESISGEISNYKELKSLIFPTDISKKIKYIGLLSRMIKIDFEKQYEICIILSGPEPQRSILENILSKQLKNYDKKIAFVRGTQNNIDNSKMNKNITVFNLLTTNKLNNLINKSKTVICRAGYSSIMDLIKLQKQAILIPTPGQTEQEYLSKYLKNKKWFYSINQEKFNLAKALLESKKYKIPKLNLLSNYEIIISNFSERNV